MPEYFSRGKGDNLPSVDKESEAQWLSVLTDLIVQRSRVSPSASLITGLLLLSCRVLVSPQGTGAVARGSGLPDSSMQWLLQSAGTHRNLQPELWASAVDFFLM